MNVTLGGQSSPEFNSAIILQNNKRKALSSTNNTEPKLKKAKIESISPTYQQSNEPFFPLLELPAELICHLVSFFAFEDILNFELSFKIAKSYTTDFWKRELRVRHLDFSFFLADQLTDQKERFIFVASIVSYIFDVPNKPLTLKRAGALQNKYSYPMQRFPDLRQIILEDLFRLTNPNGYCDFEDRSLNSTIYENAIKPGIAGEAFIEGLKILRKAKSYAFFKKAAENGATVAGLFFVSMIDYGDQSKVLKLATICARQNDHRVLDKALQEDPKLSKVKKLKGKSYPSLLLHEMCESLKKDDNREKVFKLAQRAIPAYGHKVPGKLYECLAKAYVKEKRKTKAALFYQKALASYGKNVPPKVIFKAANSLFQVENYFEADRLCARFPYQRKGNLVTTSSMNKDLFYRSLKISAKVKVALKSYKEALIFFKSLVTSDSKKKMEGMAFIKSKMGKYRKSEKIYHRVLEKFRKLKEDTLCNIADVKFRLGKFEESLKFYHSAFPFKAKHAKKAEKLFSQQLIAGNNHPDFLLMAAKNKELLKHYSEADELYDQCRQILGNQISQDVLIAAGLVKLKVEKFAEAEEILQLSLSIFGRTMAFNGLIHELAKEKMALEDWLGADLLFDLIQKDSEASDSERMLFLDWALVKTKLKNWGEAYSLYYKYFDIDEMTILNRSHIYSYAYAASRKGKIKEAAHLFKQAIDNTSSKTLVDPKLLKKAENFLNDLTPSEPLNFENLSYIAKIKFLLKDFKGSDEIYEQLVTFPEATHFTFFYASQVKAALNELKKSEEFLDEALKLKLTKNKIDYEIWSWAASFKKRLGKIREANRLYDDLFEEYGINMKFSHLRQMLFIKCELNMWHQADQICQKLLKISTTEPNFYFLISIATVKTKLGRPEAAHMMHKALKKFDKTNVNHLNYMAISKAHLAKFDEADTIFEKIKDRFSENYPPHFLYNWAYVKLQLNQFEKSVELYDQAVAKEDRISDLALESMNKAKALLEESIINS